MDDRNWERLNQIFLANRQEWQRLVMENEQLQAALRRLRRRYGLPLPTHNASAFYSEQQQQRENRLNEEIERFKAQYGEGAVIGRTFKSGPLPFVGDLQEIAKLYRLDWRKWGRNLEQLALFGNQAYLGFSMGYGGRFNTYRDESGEWKEEIIITPDMDITNPVVYDAIVRDQRAAIMRTDPIPKPTEIPGKREKDWRPVWEWCKRHPGISDTEVATILGYDRSYLSRKLNELNDGK